MLIGRGLCDEVLTRLKESYRLWCVVVCDLENLKYEEAMTRVGSQRHSKKKIVWNIVTLERRTFHQLVKKFPAVHKTVTFITVFPTVRHLSLS